MSENKKNALYVGIDLGTTYSAMAYLDSTGKPVTIPNSEGQLTTPSVVLIEPGGDVVVGREAKQAALAEPDRVAECAKRDIGERHFRKPINGKQISPQAISALILKKLRQDAQARLLPVGGAVITVPAYFNEARREATIAAGELAGLTVIDIINEPTAAALAYAYTELLNEGQGAQDALRLVDETHKPRVAVIYDLGGGTFDVSVLQVSGRDLTVLATDGDVYLGGRDWDDRIVNYAAELFMKEHGSDPRNDAISHQAMVNSAEEAKKNLSQRMQTRFTVSHAGQSMVVELTRDKFEELTADLLFRTESRLSRVVSAAGLSWSQVDDVLTVGGSTRMPQVLDVIQRVTGKQANTSLAPDEVVAHGAAIHAAIHVLQSHDKGKAAPAASVGAALPPVAGSPKRGGTKRDYSSEDPSLLPMDDEDGLPMPPAGAAAGAAPGSVPDIIDADDSIIDLEPEGDAGDAIDQQRLDAARKALVTQADDEQLGQAELEADDLVDLEDFDDAEDTQAFDPPDLDQTMTNVLKSIKTTNVNSHSLSVIMKMPDGRKINSIVVPRNSKLPISETRRYGTVTANQTAVTVVVVEGESENIEECVPIGSCQISPLPWGLPKGSTIYVTFSYDNSGLLTVKASEATSGSSANTQIDRANAMDKEQFARVKKAVDKLKVS